MTIQEKKKRLRQEVLKKLKSQKEEERVKKSSQIAQKLFRLKEFLAAQTVLFYLSMTDEVDTQRMIEETLRQGKKVAVPVIRREAREMVPSLVRDLTRELQAGPHGVRHPRDEYIRPIPLHALDLVVLPGLAFDRAGNRLGRGMGYYDKFLGRLPQRVPTVGLAFDFQVVDDFPPLEPHDFAVTTVLCA